MGRAAFCAPELGACPTGPRDAGKAGQRIATGGDSVHHARRLRRFDSARPHGLRHDPADGDRRRAASPPM